MTNRQWPFDAHRSNDTHYLTSFPGRKHSPLEDWENDCWPWSEATSSPTGRMMETIGQHQLAPSIDNPTLFQHQLTPLSAHRHQGVPLQRWQIKSISSVRYCADFRKTCILRHEVCNNLDSLETRISSTLALQSQLHTLLLDPPTVPSYFAVDPNMTPTAHCRSIQTVRGRLANEGGCWNYVDMHAGMILMIYISTDTKIFISVICHSDWDKVSPIGEAGLSKTFRESSM